jgi:hypothetical protein
MTKAGLSLAQHRRLGRAVQKLRGQVVGLRGVVKEGIGSGTPAYQAASQVLLTLQRLEGALLACAAEAHGDRVPLKELRQLYDGEGR